MTDKGIYRNLLEARRVGRKQLAMLIDPDGLTLSGLERQVLLAGEAGVDYFFLGGSLIWDDVLHASADLIKEVCPDTPLLLFPGHPTQLSDKVDAVLLLCLISGRNPDFLIGQQVVAAPYLKRLDVEVISTGYMLVGGRGRTTTVEYMTQTVPIPANKPSIAACTALAGALLGLKLSFLDAGSGADEPVHPDVIREVSRSTQTPTFVGGGIRRPEQALAAVQAGADLIVVGNAFEKNPALVKEMVSAIDLKGAALSRLENGGEG